MKRWIVLAVVVGCGGEDKLPHHHLPGPVTLTIHDRNGPKSGVRVVFQHHDMSIAGEVDTDANGVATADVTPDGFVTAIDTAITGEPELKTIAGLQINDELVISPLNLAPPAPATVDVQVMFPSNPNADRYLVTSTCGVGDSVLADAAPTLVATLVTPTSCTAFDILVAAFQTDALIGSIVTLDATGGAVNTEGPYRNTFAETALTYVNVPPTGTIHTTVAIGTARGPLHFVDLEPAVLDGSARASLDAPMQLTTVTQHATVETADGRIRRFRGDAVVASDTTIDILEDAPVGFASIPMFDQAAHGLVWTTDGDGPLHATLSYVRIDRGTAAWSWQVLSPYTPDRQPFPKLSLGDFDYSVASGDTAQVFNVNAMGVTGSYDAARTFLFTARLLNEPFIANMEYQAR